MILKKYRDIREKMKGCTYDDIEVRLYDETARSLRMRPDEVRKRVEYWMLKRPLRYMKKCRYRGIDRFCHFLQQKEVRLAVYSDYPAEDKLASLDLPRMEAICSTDEGLCMLKPNPEGLLSVTRRLGLPKKYCVFIGDRDDTDGETARKAGMPFLLRKSNPRMPNEFSDYYELLEDFNRAMSHHEPIT